MTKDEIIEMARQAGFETMFRKGRIHGFERDGDYTEELEDFAKLIAAKATDEANARSNTSWTLMCKKMVEDEREACAKLVEWDLGNPQEKAFFGDLADAIRARGEA
jgi:hypothetical protein